MTLGACVPLHEGDEGAYVAPIYKIEDVSPVGLLDSVYCFTTQRAQTTHSYCFLLDFFVLFLAIRNEIYPASLKA